jgi:hypothetical protein
LQAEADAERRRAFESARLGALTVSRLQSITSMLFESSCPSISPDLSHEAVMRSKGRFRSEVRERVARLGAERITIGTDRRSGPPAGRDAARAKTVLNLGITRDLQLISGNDDQAGTVEAERDQIATHDPQRSITAVALCGSRQLPSREQLCLAVERRANEVGKTVPERVGLSDDLARTWVLEDSAW